jgi:hypothetical protein
VPKVTLSSASARVVFASGSVRFLRAGATTGSIAGNPSWVYIWDKETRHDRFSGSLAVRAFRRGNLLYHPAQRYAAGYLRNRALDLVELRARIVGNNCRGQPCLTTSDPSNVVGFSFFTAALLLFAQLRICATKNQFRTDRPRISTPSYDPDFGPSRPVPKPAAVGACAPPEFMAPGEASSTRRRWREKARSALQPTRAAA